jgi:hypothetical protein
LSLDIDSSLGDTQYCNTIISLLSTTSDWRLRSDERRMSDVSDTHEFLKSNPKPFYSTNKLQYQKPNMKDMTDDGRATNNEQRLLTYLDTIRIEKKGSTEIN